MTDDAQAPPPSAPPPPPTDPPPVAPPTGGSASGSENRQLWIVLSYLWLLALIPFLVEQEDKEVQWHAKHGLVLTAAEAVIYMVLWAISMTGILACFGCLLFLPIAGAVLVLHVLCIVKGLNGERFIVPGLSEFADRF